GGKPNYTYRLTVNGTQIFTSASTSSTAASTTWNSTTVANGTYTLGLTVTDAAGGSATATRSITVQNGGGVTANFTTPTPNATVTGTNWAVIWLSGSSGTSNVYTLSVGAQVVGTQTTSSTGPVSIPWDTASVSNGSTVLTASARDATGNTGATSNTVTVQNGPQPLTPS